MGFTFAMSYRPTYQKKTGDCTSCHQGIVPGSQVMVGTGYFNRYLIKKRYHYGCWLEEVQIHAKDWFFANPYISTAMAPEKKAELNRLRAKRRYIQKKGGEPNAVMKKVEEVELQIAIVKSRK